MIRHNVLFQIKPTVSQDVIDNAFRLLFGLQGKLPGFIRVAGGKCKFHENRGAVENLYGFSIDFDNEDAYKAFLTDQGTHPAKEALINIIVNGYDGIYGFDMGRTFDSFPNPLEKYRTPVPRLLPPGAIR
jgi:hypothetical protein